jgi:hypothetical protein
MKEKNAGEQWLTGCSGVVHDFDPVDMRFQPSEFQSRNSPVYPAENAIFLNELLILQECVRSTAIRVIRSRFFPFNISGDIRVKMILW